MSKTIQLTRGYVAAVDDRDFEFLSRWKWHAYASSSGHIYAHRNGAPDANGKREHIFMHRVITDAPADREVDHRDRDGLNNRRKNLRVATRAQNMWNRKPNERGTSRYKGVHWHKQHQKWCAKIQVNKRPIHIGLFTSEDEAAAAYEARALIEYGDFYRISK